MKKEERKLYMRKWREENPGYNAWACKKYRVQHHDYQREWRAKNPEYNKIACKSYYDEHREEILARKKQQRLKEK